MKSLLKAVLNGILAPLRLELRSRYSGGRMFPESLRVLKTVLPRGRYTIVDIGVADGTSWLYEAFPAADHQYLLIEAHPAYAGVIDAFGKEMDAVVEHVFCGDHVGEEQFIARRADGAPRASKYARKTERDPERITVPALTLDSLIRTHALPGPYILKIDTEGAELDVLRGATSTLTKTDAVIIETPIVIRKEGASTFGEIVSVLVAHGFALFDLVELSYHPRSNLLNQGNAVFLRRNNPLWEAVSNPHAR